MTRKMRRRRRRRYLSERESLCAVKKLQPFLLLHSPKQLVGLEFTPVLASTDLLYRSTVSFGFLTKQKKRDTDLPFEEELPCRIKLPKMVSPIPC